MFGTNFCGLRSYSGNAVDCTCTINLCPGRIVRSTSGSANLYSSGSFGLIASGCSKLVRYRPRKMSIPIGNSYPLMLYGVPITPGNTPPASPGATFVSGYTSISFTTQSESVPLVDAIRCTIGSPDSFIALVSGSDTYVSTSGRPSTNRWSVTSHVRHPVPSEFPTGLGLYGTGFAGSDTY